MADATDSIMNAIQGMRDAGIAEAETDAGDTTVVADEGEGGEEEIVAPGGDNEAEGEADTEADAEADPALEADPDKVADAEGTEHVETAEEKFAREHGLKPPTKGKDNRIPYPRVQKITENAVKKAVAALTTTHQAELSARDAKLAAAAGKLEHMDTVGHIIMTNPEQYIELLQQVNPKFIEIFEAMKGGAAVGEPDAEAPKPDLDLGNGRMTYSMEGLAKLRAYDRQQAVKEANAAFEKRLKPIETERQQKAREAQERKIDEDAVAFVNSTLDKARTKWAGFKENEKEIHAAMKADRLEQAAKGLPPLLDLHDAYEVVMGPKRQLSDSAQRKRILAELKKAPASTTVVAKTPAQRTPAVEPGQENQSRGDRTEAIIRASIAKMKAGQA